MTAPAVAKKLAVMICAIVSSVTLGAAVRWSEINRQSEAWYASDEARAIATSIVQYQGESGGWTKNRDMSKPPTAEYFDSKTKEDHLTTIDNDATTTQVDYLARVVTATDDAKLKASFLRGLDYLLAAQYENGGWPQFFPLREGYYTHITYNDSAMVKVMNVLREVAAGRAPYAFVDGERRAKASAAYDKGIACMLRTQVKQGGRLSAWCAQHDEVTFAPAPARNFEPVSLSGSESVGIVRTLMQLQKPSPEVIAAIESAIAWFERSAVTGLRLDATPGADGKRDLHAVADANAPRMWARFYEIETNKPIYLGRDKIVRYDYNEIERERRVGYAYLGTWAEKLLTEEYPRWRAKHKLP